MPTITYAEHTVPTLTVQQLTLGETDALERAVGMTMKRIARVQQTCTCEHHFDSHLHRTDDGAKVPGVCTECGCREFDPDIPTKFAVALLWLAVRRAQPSLSFATFSETPMEDLDVRKDDPGEPPDPSLPASESGPQTPTPDPTQGP